MPKISVVIPTMRIGGLDIIFNSLEQQTFKDFELVLVDCLYKYRKDIVEEKSKLYSFTVKHIEPIHNIFPINAFSHCANTGLVHCDGELVFMAVDYTWLEPSCLEIHNNFHNDNIGYGLSCPHQYRFLPELGFINKYNHIVYDDSNSDNYAKDIILGNYNNVLWSSFKEDIININNLFFDFSLSDPKMMIATGEINYMGFFAKNDSIRLDQLLSVNGWNEQLDGSHGYQDYDLSDRLTTLLGLRWYNIRENIAFIINMRCLLPCGKRIRAIGDNEVIWKQNKACGYPTPNNWNLKSTSFAIKKLSRL